MGFAPNTDLDPWTCRRIIATLLAMAVLCEHAAARSLPVRLLVFWILHRAEAAALTLFAVPADASSETPLPVGDLVRLAARLRGLAMLLALACPGGAEGNKTANAVPLPRAFAPGRIAGRIVPYPDTS